MGACGTKEQPRKKKNNKHRKSSFNSEISTSRVLKMNQTCTDERQMRHIIDECFDKFDRNHDGRIDLDEVVELVKFSHARGKKDKQVHSEEFYRDAAVKLLDKIGIKDNPVLDKDDLYRFYKNM